MRMEPVEVARKIWAKDPSVWSADSATQRSISECLGWLRVAGQMESRAADITAFAREAGKDGFNRVLLLGMGGSSLAPEVFRRVFAPATPVAGGMELTVLDTTDPAAIRAAETAGDISRTLFLVSSKSGNTIEVDTLFRYFFGRAGESGDRFAAITDPGTVLEKTGREKGFRRVFLNFPDIGGRYSALSYFGLVPAALAGVDVVGLLRRALDMSKRCDVTAAERNPGLALGMAMGRAWEGGRDKVTLVPDAKLEALGLWIEQLLAESTGKQGKGIVPVAGEPLGDTGVYGSDRIFVGISLEGAEDRGTTERLAALEAAGHPVVRLSMRDGMDLGAEFFRWEFAAAAAGAVLGINPFDQPNVKEAKDRTSAMLKAMEAAAVGGEPKAAGVLEEPPAATADEIRAALLSLESGKDYLAMLAFLPYGAGVERPFQKLRVALRDRFRVATTFGFGPRYLHSTGQLHKGGANTGVFLLFTCDHAEDVSIPGKPFTFGQLERAQALGDFESLSGRGRRIVRIRLPNSSPEGAEQACAAVARALA